MTEPFPDAHFWEIRHFAERLIAARESRGGGELTPAEIEQAFLDAARFNAVAEQVQATIAGKATAAEVLAAVEDYANRHNDRAQGGAAPVHGPRLR